MEKSYADIAFETRKALSDSITNLRNYATGLYDQGINYEQDPRFIEETKNILTAIFSELNNLDLVHEDLEALKAAYNEAKYFFDQKHFADALERLNTLNDILSIGQYASTLPSVQPGFGSPTTSSTHLGGTPLLSQVTPPMIPGRASATTTTTTPDEFTRGFGQGFTGQGFSQALGTPMPGEIKTVPQKVESGIPDVTTDDLVNKSDFARLFAVASKLEKLGDDSKSSRDNFYNFIQNNRVPYKTDQGPRDLFSHLKRLRPEDFTSSLRRAIVHHIGEINTLKTMISGEGKAIGVKNEIGENIQKYIYVQELTDKELLEKEQEYNDKKARGKKVAKEPPSKAKRAVAKEINLILMTRPTVDINADIKTREEQISERQTFDYMVSQAYHKKNAGVQAKILASLVEANDRVAHAFGKHTRFQDGMAISISVSGGEQVPEAIRKGFVVDDYSTKLEDGSYDLRLFVTLTDYKAMVENAQLLAKNMEYAGTLGRKVIKDELDFKGNYKLIELSDKYVDWLGAETFGLLEDGYGIAGCWVHSFTTYPEDKPLAPVKSYSVWFECDDLGNFWTALRKEASRYYEEQTTNNPNKYLEATETGMFLERKYAKLTAVRNLFYLAKIFGLVDGKQNVNEVLNFNGLIENGQKVTVGTQNRTEHLTSAERKNKISQGENVLKSSNTATDAMREKLQQEIENAATVTNKKGSKLEKMDINHISTPGFNNLINQLTVDKNVDVTNREEVVQGVSNADLKDYVNAEHKALDMYKKLVVAHAIKQAADNFAYRAREAKKEADKQRQQFQ